MNTQAQPHSSREGGAVDLVVIGAGHAGLAMSATLRQRGIDHVVLERGEVANAWRHDRWDSLRLLTPNWLSRLPEFRYAGTDPDGFMAMPDVADFIDTYATHISAPVECRTQVISVEALSDRYRVTTNRGTWSCRSVVLASGAYARPTVPAFAGHVPGSVRSITTHAYKNPTDLASGGVLVVGASATGLQLADEIQRSGRPVTLAAGAHVRMPRVYRGRDIHWWMQRAGILDQRIDEVDDPRRARRVPSPQLIGTPERRSLDINALKAQGVKVAGRLGGIRDGVCQFSGSLTNLCAMADLKMNRLLTAIDEWSAECGSNTEVDPRERFEPTRVDQTPPLGLDLRRGEISTVLWATGYRPDYSFLRMPVFDPKGRLQHDGGIVRAAPGIVAMGLTFMRRRKSSFIHGAEDDANDLAAHLAGHLNSLARTASAR